MNKLNKFELYENLALNLCNNNFIVEMYKEINFGLQFNVNQKGNKYLLRIYEGKKGTRLDLSQIKDPIAAKLINDLINKDEAQSSPIVERNNAINEEPAYIDFKIDELTELIGIDESGKGDYFGPLVIAGVYVDKLIAGKLYEIGVTDSKKISDSKIEIIAHKIKILCKHSIVPIGNKKYNELYEKIGNLNKLLAWGHARCIENILGMVDAKFALSDQFGDESFINNALLEEGKKIILKQMPKAEKNIAVAAASILARDEFLKRLSKLGDFHKLKLPKGASQQVIEIAKKFVEINGKNKLNEIAKLHFKTTEKI